MTVFLRNFAVHIALLVAISAFATMAFGQQTIVRDSTTINTSDSSTAVADSVAKSSAAPSKVVTPPKVNRLETPFLSQDSTRLFYVCFALVLFLGIVRTAFTKYVSDLFRLFYRSNFRQVGLREQLSQNKLPSLLLNILFFVSAGMFLALLINQGKKPSVDFWKNFGLLTAGIAALYAGKYLMIQFAGWLLHGNETAGTYSFIVFLVNKMIGMLLVPVVVLMAIGYPETAQIAITVSLVVIAILMLYRFVQGFQLIKSKRQTNPVHFFIYFCAFELLPFAMIGKFAVNALATTSWTLQ